jgi:hypothetical protein
MRYFIVLLLSAILALPSLAQASGGSSYSSSGRTQWALFGGKHAKKPKKEKKAKKSKKAGKSRRAGKSRH